MTVSDVSALPTTAAESASSRAVEPVRTGVDGLSVNLPVAVVEHVNASSRLSEGSAPSDRRRHGRLAVNVSAYCHIDGVPTEQAVGDLSTTGMQLFLGTTPVLGKRVRILLSLPYLGGQKLCSLTGTVRWTAPNGPPPACAAGVAFDPDVNPADLETLRGFLVLWGSPASR